MSKTKISLKDTYLPKPYKIVYHRRETPDNFTIMVGMKIKHDPGQFVQLSLPGIGEAPISISSYSDKYITLNIHQIGNVTNALSKLRKGDYVLVRGPYGKGYPMKQLNGNNLIVIGGGCGVAPLRGVIDYVAKHRQDYKNVSLFLGYRSPDDILFRNDLRDWKEIYNLHLTVDKNPENKFCYDSRVGFVTEELKEAQLSNENTVAFICGPPVMMKFVIEILKQKGFHDDQIFVSAERLMYCGVGVCCHCMIHGKYTCTDGPVFRYDEIKDFKTD
jgi:anaerobic sulfite reductase subunit B